MFVCGKNQAKIFEGDFDGLLYTYMKVCKKGKTTVIMQCYLNYKIRRLFDAKMFCILLRQLVTAGMTVQDQKSLTLN